MHSEGRKGQTGFKPLQMEEEKFRYDTITAAVSDAAAEKPLALQCPNTRPNSAVASKWHGWQGIDCSERGNKSLQCTKLPPRRSADSLWIVFLAGF